MFVRPEFVPNDTLLTDLGCATDRQRLGRASTRTGRTSVPGVWAAGNAANPRAQVITAAGEGSAAAIAINNDLVDEDLPIAVAELPPRPPRHLTRRPMHPAEQLAPAVPLTLTADDRRSTPMSNHAQPSARRTRRRRSSAAHQAPARPDDLGRGLPDPDRAQPDPRPVARRTSNVVVRTFVLATVAVPIVIYGLMPRLHRLRGRLLTRRAA